MGIGVGQIWPTPEQRAAGITIPTTATSTGYAPGQRRGMMRWVVLGLGVLVLYLITKK